MGETPFRHDGQAPEGKYGAPLSDAFVSGIPNMDVREVRRTLANTKNDLGIETIREDLKGTLWLTDKAADLMTVLSGRQRISSVVEIVVSDTPDSFDMQEFYAAILDLMTKNSEENAIVCLTGSPDHLVMEGKGNNIQEIRHTNVPNETSL